MRATTIDFHALSNDAAVDVADNLSAAFECLPVILEGRDKPSVADAVMVCGYALLHQRQMQHLESMDTLADLRESIDFMAARPDSDEAPTDHERQVIYLALKADFLEHVICQDIREMDAALARLKRISGL